MPRNRNIAQTVSTNAKRPAIPAIKGVEEPYRQILNAMKKNIEIIQGTLGNQKVDQSITTEDIAAVVREMLVSYSPAPAPPAPPGTAAPHTHVHGATLELDSDDHEHYLLVNGARPLGGVWDINHYELENLTIHNVATAAARNALTGTVEGGIVFQKDNTSPYICRTEGGAANTALLIHSNHVDESTDITDSSVYEQTVTIWDGVRHDTGTSELGASSLEFSQYNDGMLSVPHRSELHVGIQDFVIGAFIRFERTNTNSTILSKHSDYVGAYYPGQSWALHANSTSLYMIFSSNGTTNLSMTGYYWTWTHTTDTWYHIAAVCKNRVVRLFADAVQIGERDLSSVELYNCQTPLAVGGMFGNSDQPNTNWNFPGWIDEPIVVIGSDMDMFNGFAVPDSFYPDGGASAWGRVAYHTDITYNTLDTNGDIGTSANQVPDGATVILVDGSRPLSADWDAGAHKITTGSLELTSELTLPGTSADLGFVLLIHSDHADGSQVFADSSPQSHSITVDNDVQHDTAQKVFDASSIYFDGTGDRLRIADDPSLELGSGDFCIDLRFRIDDYTADTKPTLICKWNSDTSNKSYLLRYDSDNNNMDFYYSTNGSTGLGFSFSFTLTLDTWYHVALTRDGANLRCFIDGTQIGSTENIGSSTLYNGNNELIVGALVGVGPVYDRHLKGWTDEPAIRTGDSVWTANFTPPTSAYDATESYNTSVNEFSTDGTMAGNSDDAVPTEQATKAYVDALETDLVAGLLDTRYFTETEHLDVSVGAADAGKPVKLDAAGHIDATMINDADVDHGSIGGLTDDDHTLYLLVSGARNLAGNLTQDDGLYIATDEIRARDSGGLLLRDDSGTLGITIADGGNVLIGDGSTSYVDISTAGDVVFVGGAGLCFGEIYADDVDDELTITASGKANKVQITSFAANGVSNNTTPDHTNDHITITKAGMYMCNVSVHLVSTAGGGADGIGYSVYKNNGAIEFPNLHGQRQLAGGGGDEGSISLSGIIDLAVNDTVEVWLWNVDSTANVVVDDINLSLFQIGGT